MRIFTCSKGTNDGAVAPEGSTRQRYLAPMAPPAVSEPMPRLAEGSGRANAADSDRSDTRTGAVSEVLPVNIGALFSTADFFAKK
jgi:hypothetical protein